MAHKNFSNIQAVEGEVKFVYGSFVGANGANGTSPKGAVVSATRTAEGIYDLVLRDSYPGTDKDGESNVLWTGVQVEGNAADRGFFAALDVEAKTATVELYTLADAADDCDAKTVRVKIEVRNTTARRFV